jgi:hypothetical protein
MRKAIRANEKLARKVAELDLSVGHQDTELARIVKAIRELMAPPEPKRRGIGFLADLR